jgi:DMATS type aromatic prenyltransferase
MITNIESVTRSAHAPPAASTLAELAAQQLAALAAVASIPTTELPRMEQILVELLGSSATRRPGGAPAYLSDVVDDHTPYELSVTVGGSAPEVRLLVETAHDDSSLAGRWRAARAVGRWLRDAHGADLGRLDAVADLFEPRDERGLLALWHAIVFRAGAAPEVKVYLDLRARGREQAHGLLEEALARLGLAEVYPRLLREAGPRGRLLDELVYLSLDLAAHDHARVKVYFRHHHATAHDAERVIGRFGGVEPGEVRGFCNAILGGDGPYTTRPLVSCWTFSGGSDPVGATIYAPIAYYVHDDDEARGRIHRWLAEQGMQADRYAAYLGAFARRPLAFGVGMHSYVSFKRDRGVAKATMYLAPEAHKSFPAGALAARPMARPARARSAEELVRWYETRERVADHPLFRRLAREACSIGPLWAILANNYVAVGDGFPRWLAHLVARVTDDRVRSVLAKQLNDELGNGVPDAAHRPMYQRMLADLEPHALADRDAVLAPGRRFAAALAYSYVERPELEAIGGALVAEVYGKQVDQCLGDLFRRQRDVDPASLTWLALHETLEDEHANESLALAAMLPRDPAAQAAVCRGAEELATLGFRYFDELYEVLFR